MGIMSDCYTQAWKIVLDTPEDERPSLDEWFEFEGMDINVVGADYSEEAPSNGAIAVVYPYRILVLENGLPHHIMTFRLDVDAKCNEVTFESTFREAIK